MNNSQKRKPSPTISEEIDRDLDSSKESQTQKPSPVDDQQGMLKRAAQKEPRAFHEIIDYSKLQFGQRLVGWCIFLIVALSLVGYFFNGADPDRNELSAAIELLKLVTTTALGFIFAKTQIVATQDKNAGEN